MARGSLHRPLRLAAALLGCLACIGWAGRLPAQITPGQTLPTQVYLATLPGLYEGEYRASLNAFIAHSRGGIRSTNGQWIDSICYLTMAGECNFQLGQLPQAQANFDAALKLYVAYSDWMMRVQFPPAIVAAAPGSVRVAPWGQSRRRVAIGQFPETFLMGQGQFNAGQVLQQGGVLTQPMLFPVNAAEIVRCTSLAIRRRRELLGPLGKFDPLTSDLINVLTRRPAPPNHWTEAWVQVQLGCAYAAAGDSAQAKAALERAVLVGGEFDHPLTSTALLELGRLALESGDFPAAGTLFEEASYASFTFLNPGNLEEALRGAVLAHLLLNQKGPYKPLAPAMAWAKAQGLRQLYVSLATLAAENMADSGESAQAANYLSAASSSMARTDLAISQAGARFNHVSAQVAYQTKNVEAGDRSLAAALQFQRQGSRWMFQIGLADSGYTSGQYSDRVGLALYDVLLRDPTPGDWAYSPLESLSVLSMPHEPAFEHWFEGVVENNREQELSLEIADRARRHRFLTTLQLGGRLLSLRWIMEAPPESIGERGMLERQELLARYPEYQQLAEKAAAARTRLAALPVNSDDMAQRSEQAGQLGILADVSRQQELILRQMAVSRRASDIVFPPLRKTADVQKALPDGQVLLAFYKTQRNLYGFLYSNKQYATWRIVSSSQLQKQVSGLLRDLGNFDGNHQVARDELARDNWRAAADNVLKLILARSSVELAGNFQEIAIVPDGFLWYLPFEVLRVGNKDDQHMLITQARVRYAPTVGLAVPSAQTNKPRPNVGVVLGKLYPQDDVAVATAAYEQFARAIPGAVALPSSLPAASSVYRTVLDGLVVLDDVEGEKGLLDWSPVQIDRGKPGAALVDWLALPWGGPKQVVLPGFHTSAESGLRKSAAAGDDLFLSLCALMASGTRTVLVSRWRVGGRTSYDLTREFVQELPYSSPAEAWQRSVQLCAETPVEPEHEPRIRDGAAEGLKGDHPFFWSGYMLVDPGVTNADAAATPAPPAAAPPAAPVANAAGAGNGLLPKGLAPPTADATPESPKPSDKRTGAK